MLESICNINNIADTIKSTKTIISNKEQLSFKEIVDGINKSNEKNIEDNNYKLDFDSKPVKDLEDILDFDLEEDKDRFIKKNGKINISDILNEYGSNVSGNDLKKLGETINSLYNSGAIDTEDYFYAMKWIVTKQMEKSTQVGIVKMIENEAIKL